MTDTQCYWDDDLVDVSAAIANDDTFIDVDYQLTNDYHTWPAMKLAVSADDDGLCVIGASLVDAACPPEGVYANHGEYVSCVSDNKDLILANLSCLSEESLAEVSSCIVNPRARSNIGKRNNRP